MLTTTTSEIDVDQAPRASAPAETARSPHPRRRIVLSWVAVAAAGGAAAMLIASSLSSDSPSIDLTNVRTVAEHGSVNAIDHRDALLVAARHDEAQTVAEHGSVNAIDHRDALAAAR